MNMLYLNDFGLDTLLVAHLWMKAFLVDQEFDPLPGLMVSQPANIPANKLSFLLAPHLIYFLYGAMIFLFKNIY